MSNSLEIAIIGDFNSHFSQTKTVESLNHASKELSISLNSEWLPTKVLNDSDNLSYLQRYKKICSDNSLETLNPELSREWHHERNGKLTPADVVPGSGKYVWWKCKKNHEWRAIVVKRTQGNGCPYCSKQKACYDSSLEIIYPELIKEWHSEKNGKLTPANVVPGSGKYIWWKCKKKHEWRASVVSRTRGNGADRC